jgi:hypothetical protein
VLAALLLDTAAAVDDVARLDVTLEAALVAVALDVAALDAAVLVIAGLDDGAALAVVVAVPAAVPPQAARRPSSELEASSVRQVRLDSRNVGMEGSPFYGTSY